ncbi:MAG: flagellar hook protein FlgE [Caulobacter sp.]|nr:flagellar hook protein FlgE [Caulobacter sp.]
MQVLATAGAGMMAAADRLSASAQRTAAWANDLDLGREAVEQVSAKTDFKANAAVIRTADEMTGALLDMIA